MEIHNTIITLLGFLILNSGLFSVYQNSQRKRYKRGNLPSNKLVQENKNLKFMLKQAQKEVSKSLFLEKKKYHLLADNLPVGIFRSNINGELLFVNQAMVDMFGFESEAELLKQNGFSLYSEPKDREKFISKLNEQGKLTAYKMCFMKKDGEIFIGEQNSLIEGDELHGIIQNISDRVKGEEEKSQLIKKLKAQNNHLEEFAFIISHNLRGPLANMMGLTKIFDKGETSPENIEIMNLIEQSTVNLDLIIKDLNQTLTVREGNSKI